MRKPFCLLLATAALWCGSSIVLNACAGGSGLNVVVVINQASSNSCEVGNYFCEHRQVPSDNVLFINWPGGNVSWASNDFQSILLNPLLAMLQARQLTNQIDYVVLSMDIPFQTLNDTSVNSTTAALFYGLKADSGPGSTGNTNSYAGSEQIFAQARPASAPGFAFLTTMLTGISVAQVEHMIDQGVAGDGTLPARPAILAKTSDPLRNLRFGEFDNAIFNTRLRGNYQAQRTNSDWPWVQTNLLGCETGLATLSIPSNAFAPGAIADNLTSFGGIIFGPNDQTTLLAFISAGATGSYGTVTEPAPNTDKFPNPQVYFYQARGFSLAECYYQSLNIPYQGLTVAEPLAAPFQRAGTGRWSGLASNAVLSGTTNLSLKFSACDAAHPLQQVDLFVDGNFLGTLTNLAPRPGNQLSVALNGRTLSFVVPTNSTVASVAAGLAAAINSPAYAGAAMTMAVAHGDRVELQSTATNPLTGTYYFNPGVTGGPVPGYYRVQYLAEPIPPLVTALGREFNGGFRVRLETPANIGAVVFASTNLVDWAPVFTNLAGGFLDFVDEAATNYSRRFYRASELIPPIQPRLAVLDNATGGGFALQVQSQAALPYVIQASTNLQLWAPVFTNLAGGDMNLVDPGATNFPHRFYRAAVLPAAAPPPQLAALVDPSQGGVVIQITGATRPYVVQTSTDLLHWSDAFTNLALGEVRTTAGSSIGTAGKLTTFLTASRNALLDSQAQGTRSITIRGILSAGASVQLTVTKVNGAVVNLAVTNQSVPGTFAEMALQLYNLINSTTDLLGEDGIIAQDLNTNFSRQASFNLYARKPGYAASATQVLLNGSDGLILRPDGPAGLDANLSDLRPRNHLYVTAGAASLNFGFPLDTTALPDGFHELTAVAYEGSHVRTQTRATLPIVIQNTPLSAELTLLDLPPTAPVQGVYHFHIDAGTNAVSSISLFGTGGILGTVTNQPSANFSVNGPDLGIGLHPFYAIVQTTNGLAYRTQTKWARLVAGP